MATDAQRRKLKEAVNNGGRLRAHGMQDQSLVIMFNDGLIGARITVEPEGLAQIRDRAILRARETLTASEPVNWKAAYGQLRLAWEAAEEIDLVARLQEYLRKGRPLGRYEIMRYARIVGVFVTDKGREEAAK